MSYRLQEEYLINVNKPIDNKQYPEVIFISELYNVYTTTCKSTWLFA